MKLIKSNKLQAFHGLLIALNEVIARNVDPIQVLTDLTMYKRDIALCVRKQGEPDGAVVFVNAGAEADEISVTYFQHNSMVTNDYDPFGIKKAAGDKAISMEYYHKGFSPYDGFDYPKKMDELANMIVHFIGANALPDDEQLKEHFPTLAPTIVMYDIPKR